MPRKGWREEVERDVQVMGVRRWGVLAIDREKLRGIFDRPQPTVGCSANERRLSVLRQGFSLHFSHDTICVLHIVVWLFACFPLVLP